MAWNCLGVCIDARRLRPSVPQVAHTQSHNNARWIGSTCSHATSGGAVGDAPSICRVAGKMVAFCRASSPGAVRRCSSPGSISTARVVRTGKPNSRANLEKSHSRAHLLSAPGVCRRGALTTYGRPITDTSKQTPFGLTSGRRTSRRPGNTTIGAWVVESARNPRGRDMGLGLLVPGRVAQVKRADRSSAG